MAPDLRSGSAYRDWLYDEPVYRWSRLSGGRLQRGHPHRRVDRLGFFGGLRLPVAPNRAFRRSAEIDGDNLVGFCAAWCGDLNAVTLALADQCTREW